MTTGARFRRLYVGNGLSLYLSHRRWATSEVQRRPNPCSSNILHYYTYSTSYTSVHGERPSAEYAKLRRESLENEFGHVVGAHSSKSVFDIYTFGPFLALYRAAIISFHMVKLSMWQLFVHDIKKRAIKFRETLIRLGPFYVKASNSAPLNFHFV
ncbi:hypothetical protein Dimus_024026 [Dionaea muscipula]